MSTAAGTEAAMVRDHLGAVVAGLRDVAAACGYPEVAEPLLVECTRPVGALARVVVAGATKRGKSALVNALLARPDLVPVDADVATGVHVALHWGEQDRALVHLTGEEPREIALTEVERYASERHNPGNALEVLAVQIETPAPLLAHGLELVDTPGVDSVVARHSDVTLAALGLADALVLVVDPSRPLVRPELEFLAAATTRIGNVVFVLTKTDLHREWRRVLEDDRELLAAHAPRFAGAGFLPVSSKLARAAADARAAGRHAVADRLEEASGTGELARALGAVVDGVELVRLGNVVQLALVVTARLDSLVRASYPTDAGEGDNPGAEEAALRTLLDAGSRWRQDLAHGFRSLQFDLDAHLVATVSRVDEELVTSLSTWTPSRADTLGRELDDAVRVVWLETLALLRGRVEGLVAALLETVAGHGVALARPELVLPLLDRSTTRALDVEEDAASRGVAGALGSYGAAAGLAFGAERLLLPLGLLLGIGGLGLGAAVGVAGIVLRRRAVARQREQRAAQRLARSTLAEARSQMQRELAKHLVDVQFALDTSTADVLQARRRALEEAVSAGRALRRRTNEERETWRAAADQALTRLAQFRTDIGVLHQTIASAQAAARRPG